MLRLSTGPSAPIMPTILGTTVGTTEATINWIAIAIAYTPETYFVVYGLSNDTLNQRSSAVEGARNITATNLAHSTTVTGLSPFTQYYYKIEARNSFTTTDSDIQIFQTREAGELQLLFQAQILVMMTYSFFFNTQHQLYHLGHFQLPESTPEMLHCPGIYLMKMEEMA